MYLLIALIICTYLNFYIVVYIIQIILSIYLFIKCLINNFISLLYLIFKFNKTNTTPPDEVIDEYGYVIVKTSNEEVIEHNSYFPVDDTVTIGKQLGYGAFSSVHEGFYKGNKVAIKRNTSKCNDCFYQEVWIYEHLNQLNHPSLIKLIDQYQSNMVFELVEGKSLKEFVGSLTNADNKETILIKLFYPIADVLKFLHSQSPPFTHGDLSSSNILVVDNKDDDDDIKIKLIDFGLSYREGSFNVSVRGQHKYISPEVLKDGREALSEKSDVYSFSLVVCEALLTIFEAGNDIDGDYLNRALLLPKHILNSAVVAPLVKVIKQSTTSDPAERPTFDDILISFDNILNNKE